MASPKFSIPHILFAGTIAVAIAIGPAVAGLTAPGASATPATCATNVSNASAQLNCPPGSITGLAGVQSEEQLTYQNQFDHNSDLGVAR
jgi:hypothetical protein